MTRAIVTLTYGNETAARNVLKSRGPYVVGDEEAWNLAYVDPGIPLVDSEGSPINGFHLNVLVNDGETSGLDNLPAFKARLKENLAVSLRWEKEAGDDEALQRVFA